MNTQLWDLAYVNILKLAGLELKTLCLPQPPSIPKPAPQLQPHPHPAKPHPKQSEITAVVEGG